MRLWTLVKLVAGVAVIAIGAFTGMLFWHVKEKPIDGIFSDVIPVQANAKPVESLPVEDASLPEIDPGAKVFDKARELIAMDDLVAARERLQTVVSVYPRSRSAPEARRIVGEMNMDELLSPANMEGKSLHVVRRGESFLGIAAKYQTNMDCIMHLNGMLELAALHPGDEIVVMPLGLKLLIEPESRSLSLWNDGRFIKEYHLLSADVGRQKPGTMTIGGKYGMLGDRRITPGQKGYRDAMKVFTLVKSSLQIRSASPEEMSGAAAGETGGKRFVLSPEDAEELSLVIRPGNEVEIRPATS